MMNLKLAKTLLLLVQLIQFSGCGKLEELTSGEDSSNVSTNGNRTEGASFSNDKNSPQSGQQLKIDSSSTWARENSGPSFILDGENIITLENTENKLFIKKLDIKGTEISKIEIFDLDGNSLDKFQCEMIYKDNNRFYLLLCRDNKYEDINGEQQLISTDGVLIKLRDDGSTVWIKNTDTIRNIENNGETYFQDLAIDSNDNIYVYGGTNISLFEEVGSYDIFVAKYSSSGELLWGKQFGTYSTISSYDNESVQDPTRIFLDDANGVFLTGTTWGEFADANYEGGADIFIVNMTTSGGISYGIQYGDYNSMSFSWGDIYDYEIINDSIQDTDFIYLTGNYGFFNISNNFNSFILKFNKQSGRIVWDYKYDTGNSLTEQNECNAITMHLGDLICLGSFNNQNALLRISSDGSFIDHTLLPENYRNSINQGSEYTTFYTLKSYMKNRVLIGGYNSKNSNEGKNVILKENIDF